MLLSVRPITKSARNKGSFGGDSSAPSNRYPRPPSIHTETDSYPLSGEPFSFNLHARNSWIYVTS